MKSKIASPLGGVRGFPSSMESQANLTNWDLAPFNRWSFMNMRQLFPTVDVKADPCNINKLPALLRDLSPVMFKDHAGEDKSIGDFLNSTYSDGFLVLYRGEIITEEYFNNMKPDTLHLSQSMAKSLVGSLAGILHKQGIVDPDSPIVKYIPELQQCGYRDAKLSHVLNMTSGIRFSEDYNTPDSDITRIDIAAGWRPVPAGTNQPTIRDVILTLPKVRPHGRNFKYKSIETDVVAWALERASGKSLAELVSELVWKKIGAEHDASFTIDQSKTALANGGFNATLRDYGRFGLMMQNDGNVGELEVVPKNWVDACATGNREIYGAPYTDTCPEGAYSNFWWVNNVEQGDFMARGVFGQMIYINRSAELTIVKLSTWPDYLMSEFARDSFAAFSAIRNSLA